MLLSTSKHLGPLQGRWPNLFWELGAKSLRRFETIQSNHGRSTKTLQEVNWTQNWFLSPQIFGITLRMNSHHPNPPAVGLVASFLLSYKFTIWEWSCKRPERNNKNPLWSNKQTCFSSKNLTFFTMFSLQQAHRPTGVGPRSLHPRSRGLQVEWGRSLQLLETNKKNTSVVSKMVFFLAENLHPIGLWVYANTKLSYPDFLGSFPAVGLPKIRSVESVNFFPLWNLGHFGSMK